MVKSLAIEEGCTASAESHGQRTSNLFACQDFGEEVGVPAGDLHFTAEGFLSWRDA
jgi:hypothetical protein